jgi:hypothetical protein
VRSGRAELKRGSRYDQDQIQTATQTEIQTARDHVEITHASSEKLLPIFLDFWLKKLTGRQNAGWRELARIFGFVNKTDVLIGGKKKPTACDEFESMLFF